MGFSLLILVVGALVVASLFNPTYIQQQDNGVACTAANGNPCGAIGNSTAIGYGTTSTANCIVNFFSTGIVQGGILQAAYKYLLNLWNKAIGQPVVGGTGCAAANSIFAFNPYNPNSTLFFVGLLVVIVAIGAIGGINIINSGINTGGVFILCLGTGLILLWGSLSINALPTFLALPLGIGGTIYVILSLVFTVSGLEMLGGLKTDG